MSKILEICDKKRHHFANKDSSPLHFASRKHLSSCVCSLHTSLARKISFEASKLGTSPPKFSKKWLHKRCDKDPRTSLENAIDLFLLRKRSWSIVRQILSLFKRAAQTSIWKKKTVFDRDAVLMCEKPFWCEATLSEVQEALQYCFLILTLKCASPSREKCEFLIKSKMGAMFLIAVQTS